MERSGGDGGSEEAQMKKSWCWDGIMSREKDRLNKYIQN